jgi:hypothetical protein
VQFPQDSSSQANPFIPFDPSSPFSTIWSLRITASHRLFPFRHWSQLRFCRRNGPCWSLDVAIPIPRSMDGRNCCVPRLAPTSFDSRKGCPNALVEPVILHYSRRKWSRSARSRKAMNCRMSKQEVILPVRGSLIDGKTRSKDVLRQVNGCLHLHPTR